MTLLNPGCRWLLVLAFAILCFVSDAWSQKQHNRWIFGDNFGLDFSTEPPTMRREGDLYTNSSTSTISDPETGQLLFYSDGHVVGNRLFKPMKDGWEISGPVYYYSGVRIVPHPGDKNLYYIFTPTSNTHPDSSDFHGGLSYSIVDMRGDNGLGAVVSKNIPLEDTTSWMLGVLGSCDAKSFWVISYKHMTSEFLAWHIDVNGLNTTPVISKEGPMYYGDYDWGGAGGGGWGYGWHSGITMSPSGTMLLLADGGADNSKRLYRFNPISGQVSDSMQIFTPPYNDSTGWGHSFAFSPDGKKLLTHNHWNITQYDVSVYDRDAIHLSRVIRQDSSHIFGYGFGMSPGPDGNIYFRSGFGSYYHDDSLRRIVDPNSTDFALETLYLLDGRRDRNHFYWSFNYDPVYMGGGPWTRELSASPQGIDFGQTSTCNSGDTVVTFTNWSCNPVTISDASLIGDFTMDAIQLPLTVLPGGDLKVNLHNQIDLIAKPDKVSGTLTLTTNASKPLKPITLERSIHYPVRLHLEHVEDDGTNGIERRVRIVLDGTINPATTSLTFDLVHDNEMLRFVSVRGTDINLTGWDNNTLQRQTFTVSPVTPGVVGELVFEAFVTELERSELTIENVRLETKGKSLTSSCIVSDSDNTFQFNGCGAETLTDYLANGNVLKLSIAPNPARDEIRVEASEALTSVAIYDLLGNEILVSQSTTSVNVIGLAAGTYYLRATSAYSVRTKRIVIER